MSYFLLGFNWATFDDLLGAVPIAIDWIEPIHKVFNKPVHLILILYNQIDIPVLETDSQALPAIEWRIATLDGIDMLSKQPESAADWAKGEALHILYLEGGAAKRLNIVYTVITVLVALLDLGTLEVDLLGAMLEVVQLAFHLLNEEFLLLNVHVLYFI